MEQEVEGMEQVAVWKPAQCLVPRPAQCLILWFTGMRQGEAIKVLTKITFEQLKYI